MLRAKLKKQQIAQILCRQEMKQNFQFHFSHWVMSKNVLIKIQKPQLHYCPDGLLVKLSAYQAEGPSLNPHAPFFISLSVVADAQNVSLMFLNNCS